MLLGLDAMYEELWQSFANWFDKRMLTIACCLIAIGAFMIRLSVRLSVPNAIGPDTFAHLEVARQFRANGNEIPAKLDRLTLCPDYSYPFLYHLLLSYVPEKKVKTAEMLTGPVTDGLHVFLAGIFSHQILVEFGFSADRAFLGAIVVCFLVGLSPAYLNMSGGPRSYIGSPRPLGQLLFMIFANASLLWGVNGHLFWLVVGTIAVALLLVTSKFGNQALLFIAIITALLGVFELLVVLAIGLVAAQLIWRKPFRNVVIGQIKHLRFYVNHLQAPYVDRALDGLPSYFSRSRTAIKSLGAGRQWFLDWMFSDENFLHRLVCQYPAFVAGLFLWLWVAFYDYSAFASIWLVGAPIVASLIVAGAVHTKPLRFLGEHYRYLEHTVSIQATLLVLVLLPNSLWLSVPLLVTILLMGVLALISARNRIQTQYRGLNEQWQAISNATAMVDQVETVVFPVGGVWWPIWSQSRKLSVAHWAINCDIEQLGIKPFNEMYGNFPRPTVGIDELANRYGITHTIGRTEDYDSYAEETGDRSFVNGEREPLFRSDGIALFIVSGPNSMAPSN